jgi:hypothetical protein
VGVKQSLRCHHCGGKEFYKGTKEYLKGKLVIATVYVAEDVPLPRGREPNPRESAPPVFEGGVWARCVTLHRSCYLAMGEPFGPAREKDAEEFETRAQRQAAKRRSARRGACKPGALPARDILERLQGRSA